MTPEQLSKMMELKELVDNGVLSKEEMELLKKKVLVSKSSASPKTRDTVKVEYYPVPEKKNNVPLVGVLGACLLVAVVVIIALLVNNGNSARTERVETVEISKPQKSSVPKNENVVAETSVERDKREIISLVNRWCECHSSADPDEFSRVYGPQVKYYQSDYSRERVIASKLDLLAKAGYFSQYATDFSFEEHADGSYRVYFSKVTTHNTYPSYLGVRKIGGSWRIIEESDLITDRNLAKRRR